MSSLICRCRDFLDRHRAHAPRVTRLAARGSYYSVWNSATQSAGRPAYDSKLKLVATTCKLLSERGVEATSPVMIQQRPGIRQGSMYHHFPGERKEGLSLEAISQLGKPDSVTTAAVTQRLGASC